MIDDVKSVAKPTSGSDNETKTDSNQTINLDLPIKMDTGSPSNGEEARSDFNIDDLAVDSPKGQGDTSKKMPKLLEPKNKRKFFKFNWKITKKEWLSSAVIVIICGVIVALVINHTGQKPVAHATTVIPPKKPTPVSNLVPSTLTGLPVAPAVNKTPVTGVMIENSDFARPQSGLSQAGVVFEAIAEGGITRFLALYQDSAPANVGPIRSVRPYYEQWALGFDASLAHVGGSPEALADINAWGVKNLDQFYNSGSYHRISTRAAPHNVYTSIGQLNQLEASKGFTSTKFSGFVRKKEAPLKVPTAKTINLAISGPDYGVHYDYNAATNSYNRVLAGQPHIDANTNQQISPKVVIAMVIPYSLEADGYHSDYGVIGSGAVDIFQDGSVTTGVWSKSAAASQITFKNSAGQTIGLNPGQTWITAVVNIGHIQYTP